MKNTVVLIRESSYPTMLGQMWRISKDNRFTQWGFVKHCLLQVFIPGWTTVYAVDVEKLAGFSFIKGDFLYRVVVDKEYRGKGIGKMLIPKRVKRTSTNREEVILFYTQMGYKVTGKKGEEVLLEKR